MIRALFTDIGGVLATNGWDTETRHAAVEHFGLDAQEVDGRHRLTFELYETGKLTWNNYLDHVIFYRPRPFSFEDFTQFALERSRAYPDMIGLIGRVKRESGLKVLAVSNEGRELTEYRIRKLGLDRLIDFFVCSCFVHLRKPDPDMYRLSLDLAQVQPEDVAYLEDREMFVEVARKLGLRTVLHRDEESTRAALAQLGLRPGGQTAHEHDR